MENAALHNLNFERFAASCHHLLARHLVNRLCVECHAVVIPCCLSGLPPGIRPELPTMRKEPFMFSDTLPFDGASGLASNSSDGYQSEETTLDRMLRQFKSGLFGVLYISTCLAIVTRLPLQCEFTSMFPCYSVEGNPCVHGFRYRDDVHALRPGEELYECLRLFSLPRLRVVGVNASVRR
jgi:hypothetical protein